MNYQRGGRRAVWVAGNITAEGCNSYQQDDIAKPAGTHEATGDLADHERARPAAPEAGVIQKNRSTKMTSQRYGRKYAEGGYGATVNHLLGLGAKWDPAHEIAQAAWARGWERISQLRNEASLQWWVNAIARYLMISALRRDRRWVPLESEHELVSVSQIDNVGAKHLLQGCNSDERHLLEAYYLDGYTCPEIAVKLEKSVSAVQTALHRARRSVRIRTKLTAA